MDYVFQALTPEGRAASSAMTLEFATDEGAMRHALGPDFPHGCDLWCEYRLVGRFCGPAKREAAQRPLAA